MLLTSLCAMLITPENLRSNAADTQLACTLAAVAGALNTVAFEMVGFFSAFLIHIWLKCVREMCPISG